MLFATNDRGADRKKGGHLRTLEFEGGREQIIFDGKQLVLEVDITNNFKPFQLGRSTSALHLFHDCGLELGAAAKSSHLTLFSNSILSSPLLGNVNIGDDDSNKHALCVC